MPLHATRKGKKLVSDTPIHEYIILWSAFNQKYNNQRRGCHGMAWHGMAWQGEILYLPVELPASVADLATGLANVDGDAFALQEKK